VRAPRAWRGHAAKPTRWARLLDDDEPDARGHHRTTVAHARWQCWCSAARRKVGKSDFLINLLVHAAGRHSVSALHTTATLRIFYLRRRSSTLSPGAAGNLRIDPAALVHARRQPGRDAEATHAARPETGSPQHRAIHAHFPTAPPTYLHRPIRNLFDGVRTAMARTTTPPCCSLAQRV